MVQTCGHTHCDPLFPQAKRKQAVRIQSMVRGRKGRKQASRRRKVAGQKRAAVAIQKRVRGAQGRRKSESENQPSVAKAPAVTTNAPRAELPSSKERAEGRQKHTSKKTEHARKAPLPRKPAKKKKTGFIIIDFQEATFRFSASRGLPARAGWGVRIALYILMYIRVR